MEVGGSLYGRRSNGSRGTLNVSWKQLEVCDTRESRWKYVGVWLGFWMVGLVGLLDGWVG